MKTKLNKQGFAEVAILVAVVVVLAGGGVVAAASDSARPGDRLYGVDRAVERVRLTLSVSEEGEAGLRAQLAAERLDELQSLIDDETTVERIEQARENMEQGAEDALDAAETARDNGRDVSDVMEQLTENSLRQAAVLDKVTEKVPEAAQEGISRAREASQRSFERASDALTSEDIENIRDQLRAKEPKLDIMIPPPRFTEGDLEQTTETKQSDTNQPSNSPDGGLDSSSGQAR